jgi:transposase
MILDLHRQGAGVSVIARRTGLDRKTIRKIIASGLEPLPSRHSVVCRSRSSTTA